MKLMNFRYLKFHSEKTYEKTCVQVLVFKIEN